MAPGFSENLHFLLEYFIKDFSFFLSTDTVLVAESLSARCQWFDSLLGLPREDMF
jgi:hypothetical protein